MRARRTNKQSRPTRFFKIRDSKAKAAEARRGAPASLRGTARGGEAGLLQIDFPGFAGERALEHISWDEWLQKFDELNLEFLYQDKTKDGKTSRFFKLVRQAKGAPVKG